MDSSSQRASTAWTPHEDQILLHARAQGQNWTPIQAAHFPNKTPNACRKRHERLIERRNVDDWGGERFEDLARNYMEVRSEMWSILAARIGEKWQVVESKCMERGLKNLQAAGRSALRKDRMSVGGESSRTAAAEAEADEAMDTASEGGPGGHGSDDTESAPDEAVGPARTMPMKAREGGEAATEARAREGGATSSKHGKSSRED